MKRLVLGSILLLCGGATAAQSVGSEGGGSARHFAVYTGEGEATDLNAIVAAMADTDVVFIGERHNDPTGHVLELMLLTGAQTTYGAEREVVLSLEMFESDVQTVLDEYLGGYIRESDFLKASRPWSSYESDYKPLIEFARSNGLPVIAANAPARYTSLGRRRGLATLDSLAAALELLPHHGENGTISGAVLAPSAAYNAKFVSEMEEMGAHGSMQGGPSVDEMMIAQNLRDASMAFWIAESLTERHPLIIQINGSFHSEGRMGIPEHLAQYAPGTRMLVVTMNPAEDINTPPKPSDDDFVILTDEALMPEE